MASMREYWANEAAKMRDKSGVLGKEVLMPVGNTSSPKTTEEDFKTGYWLEGNTIVFSTFVYDKFGIGKNKIDEIMLEAQRIRKEVVLSLEKVIYEFKLQYQIIDKPKYDINIVGNLTQLKEIYYMEIVDGNGTGVTHFNALKPTKAAYFQIKAGTLVKYGDKRGTSSLSTEVLYEVGRVINHESFHPLIDHIWAYGNMNPLEKTIWIPIRDEIEKYRDPNNISLAKKKTKESLKLNFIKIINDFKDNIMLSPEMLSFKTDINTYRAECIYDALDIDIQKSPNKMSKGTSLHQLQFESILKKLT